MNIIDLLPTKKVTAFLLGAAIVLIGFWLVDDVFGLVDKPDALIFGAFTIFVGFILAWLVPESAWIKATEQISDEDPEDS